MPVFVYIQRDGRVVIEAGTQKITLTEQQGKLVLKKLAEIYGYRLSPVKPEIRVKYDPIGKTVKIDIYEGKTVKPVVLPVKVLRTYLRVLRMLGKGRHDKKVLAKLVMDKLVEEPDISRKLLEYYVNGEFDWKRFFGGRQEYYELFRAPILLFDRLGILQEKRGTYITITDRVDEVDEEKLEELLRSGS